MLKEAMKRGALRVTSREPISDHFEVGRGEAKVDRPIHFVRDEGHNPYDIIGTTYATLCLFSERFVHVLEEYSFSGWTTFPVVIELDKSARLDGYHGLAIKGRCGTLDDALSEEIILPPPVAGGRSSRGLRGLCFAPDSWDGSDLFTAEGYAGIFIVERVKRALEEAGITNARYRRLSEIERTWRVSSRS